ncbi:MAG: hypothetical protein M3Z85_09565 [Acidobacteriota bacterium]|nr:hypothetical protein [Acidobacteriota bacterium]
MARALLRAVSRLFSTHYVRQNVYLRENPCPYEWGHGTQECARHILWGNQVFDGFIRHGIRNCHDQIRIGMMT